MSKFDFNSIANTYDDWYKEEIGKISDKIEKKVVKKYLDKFSSKTVLEVGAGTGHWTQFLSDNGYFVLGIDIAQQMIISAQNKNIPFSTFLNCNVQSLPYNSETIENVVAFTSLEFVDDTDKAFDEIYRVLKKGGSLLIGILNANGSLSKRRNGQASFENYTPFTFASIYQRLKVFGDPEIEGCALLPDLDNLENAIEIENNSDQDLLNEEGNFLVAHVIKK